LNKNLMSSEIRALVVEDDPSWQQILAEILTDLGLIVDLAASAVQARQLLQACPHRLAVLDLSLGGRDHHNQDGLQVLADIQRLDPGCVALFLTGYATVELAVSVIQEQGAFTLLQKESFKISAFREIVSQALALKPPAPDSAGPVTGGEASQQPTPGRAASLATSPPRAALVVEDDAGWRSLFAELLADAGFQVDLCSSAVEALGLLKNGSYQTAVVDLSLASSLDPQSNLDGYRLLQATFRAGIPTIVVSGYASPDRIEQAYREYNLFACLEKQSFERAAFLTTIARLDTYQPPNPLLATLTPREKEVLDGMVRGLTNKEIANELFVSQNTVKKHLKSIFEKLEVSNRAAASARAISDGFSLES
jgi:DNA-binding NarL/FixJ family response regulator